MFRYKQLIVFSISRASPHTALLLYNKFQQHIFLDRASLWPCFCVLSFTDTYVCVKSL